jgi:hypothetical protein
MKKKKAYKQAQLNFTSYTNAEVPLQATDREEAVLGAIMLEKSTFDGVIETFKPDSLHVEGCQPVFLKSTKAVESKKQHKPEEKNETISVQLGTFRLKLINPGKRTMSYVLVTMGFIIFLSTLFFVLHYYL